VKAKLIYESIDFERGLEPKKSLKIGKYRYPNMNEIASILFVEEKDYNDFKQFLEEENFTNKVIINDIGEQKYSSDTGGWYINISKKGIKEFYGDNWESALEEDFESVLIA